MARARKKTSKVGPGINIDLVYLCKSPAERHRYLTALVKAQGVEAVLSQLDRVYKRHVGQWMPFGVQQVILRDMVWFAKKYNLA